MCGTVMFLMYWRTFRDASRGKHYSKNNEHKATSSRYGSENGSYYFGYELTESESTGFGRT